MPLKLLFTTDNHVGFNELDPVRGDDATNAFAEVLEIAKTEDVDLVLQGGDLFHVNKPSKRSMYQVMKLLRQYCLGNKPVEFEVLNHGQLALSDAAELDHVNFEDPNFNVGLPIFAISGNHDDAGGSASRESMLSPLDLLSMSGMINHFGRIPDNTKITVKPILIEKYGIKVAIYGMANVRDERLYRTFMSGGVHFLRPKTGADEWYNILMVHQNHTQFGPKSYLPEQFLPDFMDLVLWGHEHECKIDPVYNETKGFYVVQPGSSVATSLSASEAGSKHVLSVSIDTGKQAVFGKHILKAVRPLILRTVTLSTDLPQSIKPMKRDTRAKVTEWLITQVEEMIEEADAEWLAHHGPEEPKMLPLIRLRVDYSGGYELENITRFSNRFIGRVANSNDVLHLIKRRNRLAGDAEIAQNRGLNRIIDVHALDGEAQEATSKLVPLLMKEELRNEDLEILKPTGMVDALQRYVEKDEKQAIKIKVDDLVKDHIKELEGEMQRLDITRNVDDAEISVPAKRVTTTQTQPVPETKKRSNAASQKQTSLNFAPAKAPSQKAPSQRSSEKPKARSARPEPTEASIIEESEDEATPPVPAKPKRSNRATMQTSDIPLFVDFEDDSDDAMFSESE